MKNFFRLVVVYMGLALCLPAAHAKLATVGAVHDYVRARWAIDIPRTHAASNLLNMTYLMQVVDAANLALNGWASSDYATDSKYATSALAATVAAKDAIERLIKPECPPDLTDSFCFIPAATSTSYSFKISAAGNYILDWGDGQMQTIEKTNTSPTIYSHTYQNAASNHRVILRGKAIAYSSDEDIAAISFYDETTANAYQLKFMRGCLGCVFSTLADGSQPRFYRTFQQNPGLTCPIPSELFHGITGAPVSKMFAFTFMVSNISNIPGTLFAEMYGPPAPAMFQSTFNGVTNPDLTIPGGLFDAFVGPAAPQMFYGTFADASAIKGEIPAGLFDGISGPPAEQMFQSTFNKCRGLSGKIPDRLFANISGDGANKMFAYTFQDCNGLTGIGDELFGEIESVAGASFAQTFERCTRLTGPSATVGFGEHKQYLYQRWPTLSTGLEGPYRLAYSGASGLSDYACIPTNWGGAGTKQPGECEPVAEEGADNAATGGD